ncbi:hypothetical protein [Actinomadura sp. 7K507]|uniref:hypothetical protein n=1 Tax=Actinomadura sp. 7K507 TaxID=2530365 RepID=UPI001044728C|nr:hypothetical protein [Actinomadura sp. 7K507]TDC90781.1 hypothetical protein E1285_14235 [Actinomadura sp. 7K507]
MRRIFASAAIAGAALLALPVTAHAVEHAVENDVHTVPLPFFWPRAELNSVASDDAGGVWIAGGQGAYCVLWDFSCVLYSAGNPVVRRWTGSSWTEYPLNGWTGNGMIERVATGAGQTWIGGGRGNFYEYLAVFDGASFQKVDRPSSASVGMLSTGPAGTWITQPVSPDSDEPHLLRRDGDAWADMDLPDRRTGVNDLQARTATDVWVAGSRRGADGTGRYPALLHFDGASWTPAALPDLPGEQWLGLVRPAGENELWVAGAHHLAHRDGDGWTVIPGPENLRIEDLAIDGSGTPWVTLGNHDLYRYAGGAWQPVALPAGGLFDITFAGPSTLWGVGYADGPAVMSDF